MSSQSHLDEYFYNLRSIGSGGLAGIFLAEDRISGRTVVLKTLKDEYRPDEQRRERFKKEALLQSLIHHPNVVQVLDYLEVGIQQFIVMEYVEGETLWKVLKNHPELDYERKKRIGLQTCLGVSAVHQSGIIHCDIKPLNLLITPDGNTKLTDFGEACETASMAPETFQTTVWGSPLYMAPEMSEGGMPLMASDVYSLGIILYQMFVGKLPFFSEDADELARLHREAKPVHPLVLNPFFDKNLEKIILQAIAKNAADRFTDAVQLLITYQNWITMNQKY